MQTAEYRTPNIEPQKAGLRLMVMFSLVCGLAVGQGEMTAEQIVDLSIGFCGGEGRIKNVKTASINYLLVQPDGSKAVVSEKVKNGQKYVQSILSTTHVPQTTFYDGKTVTRVNGSTMVRETAAEKAEEAGLKLYNQIQYGYKALAYKLTRLPDKKFQNFDCYVVDAKAPGGYTTTNFFDKSNYRLLMVAYPNGNKSLMVEYVFEDSVMFNSRVLNTFSNSQDVQELILQHIKLNEEIPDIWFNCPYSNDVTLPSHIKTGTFESVTGAKTMFTRNEKTQDYYDNGKVVLKRLLTWTNNDTFGLVDENNAGSPESQFIVRIISWDNEGYVCHWIAGNYTDMDYYKVKRP